MSLSLASKAIFNKKTWMKRQQDNRRETLGKLFGDHVKGIDMGTRAATLDVAVPFIHAMKKSHHDFMVRCKTEMSMSAEQRMQAEMLPEPRLKELTPARFLLKNMRLTSTMHQSLLKLKEFTCSDDALLYIVSKEKELIILCPTHIHAETHRVNFKIEPKTTLASYVAYSGNYVVIEDVLKDARFPLGLGYLAICNQAAMGVPVQSSSGEMIAVFELSRKTGKPPYGKRDELAALCLAKWMGSSIGITTEIQLFVDRHQYFNYIKHIIIYYSSAGDFPFEIVLTHLMTFSEHFFRASKGRLYVLSKYEEDGKMIKRLEMFARPEAGSLFVKTNIDSLGVKNSVAQTVMRTGNVLNLCGCVVTEYETWFDDDSIVSILCQPITGSRNRPMGAIEVFNKCNGIKFTNEDEELLLFLSKYLTVLLKFYRLAIRRKKLKAKIGLYTEMLSEHMKPCTCLMERFNEPIQVPEDLFTFSFFPDDRRVEYLAKLSEVVMNRVLGCCHFPELDLARFLITLAKAYDNTPPFTNFLHAFTVFHIVAVLIINHRGYFSKPQQEYMLMAALFHGFGINKLSMKYSKGFEFASFSSHYINLFFKIFKHSDKARSFWVNMLTKACAQRASANLFHTMLGKLILKDRMNWDNEIHRFIVMALLMRVAEDAMWYKPFQYTAHMSRNLLIQMRQEKAKLEEQLIKNKGNKRTRGKKPSKVLTGKEFVAKQINDIRTKCLPNIEILGYILPGALPLLSYACGTVEQWELIMRGEDCWIWEQEMSWPKRTDAEKDFYFSPVDYFIKEQPSDPP